MYIDNIDETCPDCGNTELTFIKEFHYLYLHCDTCDKRTVSVHTPGTLRAPVIHAHVRELLHRWRTGECSPEYGEKE